MTRLLWDNVGERFYEAGVDRGVLYLSDGSGVVWNGLTSVVEDFSDEDSDQLYFDGQKYLDKPLPGDFSATLTAFMYPDEFLEYEGSHEVGNGIYVDDQTPKMFGMTYRTMVGNDTDGNDHGYKIHILYNLTAVPEDTARTTLTSSPNALDFSWHISAIPQEAKGYRPTAHVILDSRYLTTSMVGGIEGVLYGGRKDNARLPSINELIDLLKFWDPRIIIPNTVTGLDQLTPGLGDLTPSTISGIYVALSDSRLSETTTDGIYQLV